MCFLLLALSPCWQPHFFLEHILGNFTNHSTLIALWLWMFIFLPRTSVTQLSLYPPLLYCITHQILQGRSVACVCHITALQWMVEWKLSKPGHTCTLTTRWTISELTGSPKLMSELILLRFRISSLLCYWIYSKYSLEYWLLTMFGPARRPGTISTSQCGFSPFWRW